MSYRLPKNEERRSSWIRAIRRENWIPSATSALCSEHFLEKDIDRTSLSRVRVREDAIPSVFPGFPSYMKTVVKQRKSPAKRKFEELVQEEEISQSSSSGLNNDTSISADQNFLSENNSSPTKQQLKEKLQDVSKQYESSKKKIKLLQQSKRRQLKKKAHLETVISSLRNKHLVDEKSLDILQNIPTTSKNLLMRQVKKHNNEPLPRTYDPDIRTFALTLNFFSPKAYKYVRKNFSTCLPHPRTISKWYSSVDGKPGITAESMHVLKKKVEHSQYPILCNLVLDEMAIRRHVEWDGMKYHGYVDMGTGIDDDSLPVAKEALTVMLVAINDNWKLPVAYFLTEGLDGQQRSNIVNQILEHIYDTGARVCSLTFDGCAANLAMAKRLGCILDHSELSTSFLHPKSKEPIVIFLDPCHMLKLVRNTLGDRKCLFDCNQGLIKWVYIEELKNLQDTEGIHLANKLRSAHVEWQRQKMKVKLAAQVLSDSVADAIEFCSDRGLIKFKGSQPLCKFLRMFNRLFDIFNSRNILQKEWKKPLNPGNIDNVSSFLFQADEYISGLLDKNKTPLIKSNRKTGFIGFKICIKSLLGLYNTLFAPGMNMLKYLPTYKLSQDHLEIFFSCIRSQGGFNNNPTARQFQSAYKKMLIHCQVSGMQNGNCVPLEELQILQASSSSNSNTFSSTMIINHSTNRSDIIDDTNDLPHLHDHSYVNVRHPLELTELSHYIITYIAGFVVRKLEKAVKCSQCCSVLRSCDRLQLHALINKKSRGGLTSPSPDVIRICRISERIVRKALYCGKHNILGMVSGVLKSLGNANIFQSLHQHSLDQLPHESHWIHLIRSVAYEYMNIRLHHSAKTITQNLQTNKIRHKFNKLVLFQGQ